LRGTKGKRRKEKKWAMTMSPFFPCPERHKAGGGRGREVKNRGAKRAALMGWKNCEMERSGIEQF